MKNSTNGHIPDLTEEKILEIISASREKGNLSSALHKLGIKDNDASVISLINHYKKYKYIHNPKKYSDLLLKKENSMLKIPKLTSSLDKMRYYLGIFFSDEGIQTQSQFLAKYQNKDSKGVCKNGKDSCGKDIKEICDLFKVVNSKYAISQLRNLRKELSPEFLAMIYDVHTIYYLYLNLLLLGRETWNNWQKCNNQECNFITEFIKFYLKDCNDDKKKSNLRKNKILPRLNDLEKYGIIKRDKWEYCKIDKFKTNNKNHLEGYDASKMFLKKIIPFYCGVYPLASIGHFILNRIGRCKEEEIFKFENYNACNILDDSITLDILNAIEQNKIVLITTRDDNKVEIIPKFLRYEKDTCLLQVIDEKGKDIYLKNIVSVDYENKSDNMIFSELYSFYYNFLKEVKTEKSSCIDVFLNSPKTEFEKLKTELNNKTQVIKKKYEKHYWLDNNIINAVIDNLVYLEFENIPITELELRWLKTIFDDKRSSLFKFDSAEEEKIKKENFAEILDVRPFDLSKFYFYSEEQEKYISFEGFKTLSSSYEKVKSRKVDKIVDDFQHCLQNNRLETSTFSLQKNRFIENYIKE